jgi:RsiW-degrading membrane proteinase PrsW (M82 family)
MDMGSVKEFFSEVFKRHTEDDAEEIVVCGAPGTIPDPATLSSACPKPWLYSRVFLFFLLVTVLLFAANVLINEGQFGNVLVVGAFGMPSTVLVLFFEFNVFRNISFYTVFKALFIGGGMALITTAVLPSFRLLGNTSALDALAAGVGEEIAKLLVVYWILKRNRDYPYVLNGLLIGAAVGAGFAAFETAEYGLRNLLAEEDGWLGHRALFVLTLRNLLAPGGHVVWAALSGAALLAAMRREPLSPAVFGRKEFWGVFLLPVSLHVLWNLPLDRTLWRAVFRCMGLTLVAWWGVAWFICRGLKEVDALNALPPPRRKEGAEMEIAGTMRRLGARAVDGIVFASTAFTAVECVRSYFGIGDWLDWGHTQLAFAVAILPLALLLEGGVFEVFGTTPGKWAFALRLLDGAGQPVASKTYFRRLFRLWWSGMGCGIPFLGPLFATYQTLRFAGERFGAALGWPHDFLDDGVCRFVVELDGGRRQTCCIPPAVVETETHPCFLLVSPVATYDNLDEPVRRARLDENVSRREHVWVRYGDHLALRALVPTSALLSEVRQAIEDLVADADAEEAELGPEDQF